jgi:hypothetical protein
VNEELLIRFFCGAGGFGFNERFLQANSIDVVLCASTIWNYIGKVGFVFYLNSGGGKNTSRMYTKMNGAIVLPLAESTGSQVFPFQVYFKCGFKHSGTWIKGNTRWGLVYAKSCVYQMQVETEPYMRF